MRGNAVWLGQFQDQTGGSFFLEIHLAKLNPKCHISYTIVFTEITFYLESSNLFFFVNNDIFKILFILYWYVIDMHVTVLFKEV